MMGDRRSLYVANISLVSTAYARCLDKITFTFTAISQDHKKNALNSSKPNIKHSESLFPTMLPLKSGYVVDSNVDIFK